MDHCDYKTETDHHFNVSAIFTISNIINNRDNVQHTDNNPLTDIDLH